MTASALAWLNDLMNWLGRWIPRLVLIHPTHRGVRFGPRGAAKSVGPGVVLYWPITHDLIQVPITTQSVQLGGQILPDSGNTDAVLPRVFVCVLNVQFSIDDAVKAATRILNFHAIVANRAQSLAVQHWRPTETEWIATAERELQAEMLEYGIAILGLDIAGMGSGVVVKQVQSYDYGISDSVNGKRPE